MKRTSEELGGEAQEDEPPNLFQRVGPAQSDLKRSAPDSVPGSETKLQRISAVFEDDSLPVVCACVASISTKSGLDVPIEPNVDREEELHKHFAQQNPYFGTTLSLTASKRLQE